MEKRQIKRAKIAKAAAKLFNEVGYPDTDMNHIAIAAKLSKGGIYNYFSSKNEILFFILDNYMDIVLNELEQGLKKIEDNHSKLRFIILHHIEYYLKNVSEGKTLLHDAHCLKAKYFKVIAQKEKRYYQMIANVISDFLGHRIQKNQLTIITFTLLGMCNWIYSWYNPKGSVKPPELSEIISDIFFKGLSRYHN